MCIRDSHKDTTKKISEKTVPMIKTEKDTENKSIESNFACSRDSSCCNSTITLPHFY